MGVNRTRVRPALIPNPLRPDRRAVLWWSVATLVANTLIILTGGLVRLTASGLGCPTWPKCTDQSFVPHRELGIHGVIEFGNRMLTYVLIAVVIAMVVAVWRWTGSSRSLRQLAVVLAAGVPFQGVIGGITVLTDLNPWIVALHMMLSMALVALSVLLILRVRGDHPAAGSPIVQITYASTWVTVYLGTVVTGAGPHAGDLDSPRNGLDPQLMSHVHAASVYLLVALTALCIWRSAGVVRTAAVVLLVVELAQGLIGFVQYFTDLPIALVAVHILGAAILVAAATRLLLTSSRDVSPATGPTPRKDASLR